MDHSKRFKIDTQNHNYVQKLEMPDLIRDAYGFGENYNDEVLHTANPSSVSYPKK